MATARNTRTGQFQRRRRSSGSGLVKRKVKRAVRIFKAARAGRLRVSW